MPSPLNPVTYMESFTEESPQKAYQDLGVCPFLVPETGVKVLAKRQQIVEFNRHALVRATDGEHWTLGAKTPLIPLDLDGDNQRHFRRLLDPLFSPKAVAPLEAAVRAITDQLVDEFIELGSVELYEGLCSPAPSIIFLNLLGLPESDLAKFVRFKDSVIRPQGDTPDERRAYAEAEGQIMTDYLNLHCDQLEMAGNERPGLIGGLLRAAVDGRHLTRVEIVNIVYLLVIAGLDTVVSSLSCMFSWFAQHPEERLQLINNPATLPTAVEELLRYESPVMTGSRYVTEDFDIDGWQFKAGEQVVVMWASANVDADAFDNPLVVDLNRQRNAHIDFATGPHRCLGSNLARMELRAVIDQFHKRIPDYWITPGARPTYTNLGVRAAYSLPISFPPGKRVAS